MWRVGLIPYSGKGLEYITLGYLRGLKLIGAEPVVIRHETPLSAIPAIVDTLDGMLFTGGDDVEPTSYGAYKEPVCGECEPLRDALEPVLLEECLKRGMPIFGICRGCQIINVALGGTLTQDIPTRYGTVHQMTGKEESAFSHDVRVVPGTRTYEALRGDLAVDSYHHQCVERLAEGLIPTAYAPEGFIEAYEGPRDGSYLLAVQWHPEVSLNNDMASQRLFGLFEEAIRRYRSQSA